MQRRKPTERDFATDVKSFARALRALDDELRAADHLDSYARKTLRAILHQTSLICEGAATLCPAQAVTTAKTTERETA